MSVAAPANKNNITDKAIIVGNITKTAVIASNPIARLEILPSCLYIELYTFCVNQR